MQAIDYAVTRLTETHTVQTDAGPVEWPPLVVWLERSVTEVVKRGGAGGNGAGIPIDFEALRLLDRIKREVAWMREALYMPRKGDGLLSDVAAAWARTKELRASGDVPDDQWERICEAFEDWVQAIISEQEARARMMELTVPCPSCGTRWILEDQDGEEKRRSAVWIEYGEGRAPVAECRAPDCGTMWAGWREITTLGVTVGVEQNVEILAACGIDMTGVVGA